jgi:hypothetical protein
MIKFTTPLYLGFSSLRSKDQTQIFDDGLIELRRSGRLNAILLKYGVADWHQQYVML